MPAAEPVADRELPGLFDAFAAVRGLALAVSGGADSLALLLCAQRWRTIRGDGPPLIVLTVDHGLRPGSADEAAAVLGHAAALGLPARLLAWEGRKPAAGIEAAARAARYRLLSAAAAEAGATHLLTAHHRDDQAETLLMRLGHGSGLAGLGAMRPMRALGPVTLARPLLGVARDRLVATVRAAGLVPADDPTNRDPRYARARLRRLAPELAAAGLDPAALARAAGRLARASEAIDHYAGRLLAEAATVDACGAASLSRPIFASAPRETRLRALETLLGTVRGDTGAARPPFRLDRLEALEQALTDQPRFRRTLGGVVIDAADGVCWIYRETGRFMPAPVDVSHGFDGVWDGRFRVTVAAGSAPIELGALGRGGAAGLRGAAGVRHPPALPALPALRRAGELVAVPSLGFRIGGTPLAEARAICLVRAPAVLPGTKPQPSPFTMTGDGNEKEGGQTWLGAGTSLS